MYTKTRTISTDASIPATVLALIGAIIIVPLVYLEHHRSIRPSTLTIAYLSFSILLDIPQARTLYLLKERLECAATFSAVIAVKSAMLLLELQDKRGFLEGGYEALPLETTSSIFSRSLFLWMNSLFLEGLRKILSDDDLGKIDNKLESLALHQRIQKEWMLQNRLVKWPLLRCLWRALRWSVLSPIPPRLAYGGFVFAQPFLIHRATEFLSLPESAVNNDIGYGLIAATACIYLGIAISTALFKHQLYRHITLVRGSLVPIVFTQSLTMEQTLNDPSAAVTLMNTDVDRICQSLVFLHDLWSRPVELVVGISLLTLQIGWLSVMPLVVVLLSVTADSRVTQTISAKAKIWTDAVQQRISLTAEVLASLKLVKMLGLTEPIHTMLQNERLNEVRLQKKFRWSTVWLNTLGNVPTALSAAATFVAYAIKARLQGSNSLNASQAFTSLALISLVTVPATEILTAFPAAASCMGSLSRIEQHLMRPRLQNRRRGGTSECARQIGSSDRLSLSNEDVVARMSHVTIRTANDSLVSVRDLNVSIRQNTFTVIRGPSGSGKSTLLNAMLGEVNCSGIFVSTRRISYCPQTPWLFAGTIRQNICGLSSESTDPIDDGAAAWYKTVLSTCLLESHLLSLPEGDRTYIKAPGANLSEELKQRISLARALYARPRLLLLDDAFSTLDANAERTLVKRLLSPTGLLRRCNAAVVLTTHGSRYKSLANTVIDLDGEGNSSVSSHVPRLANDDCDGHDVGEDIVIHTQDPAEKASTEDVSSTVPVSRDADSTETAIRVATNTGVTQSAPSAPIPIPLPPPAEGEAPRKRRDGDLADYSYYFNTVRWPMVALFFFFATAQTVCFYMSQVILQWWTTEGGLDAAKWMPLYLILACANALLFGFTVWVMFLKLVPESAVALHRILLDTVMQASYSSFLAMADVGVLLNRFSQDMTLIESQLPTGVLCTTIYLFWTLGSLALICTGSSWMALTVPAVFVGLFVIQWVYLRTSRRLRVIELELRSPLYSHFLETLNGLSSIRAFGWEQQFTDAMIVKLDASQVPYYLLYCAQRWLQLVLDLVIAALALIVMTLAVKLRTSTDPGSLGLSLNNILSFNEILSILLQYWTQLEVSLGSIARIREFSGQTPSERTPTPATLPQRWPESGSIDICGLSASYTGTKAALSNVSMTILPGEKIGICGRTGSGKSSLLLTILRLLEPSDGSVVIDGVNLRDIAHTTIRERILTIPQEPLLLKRSVRFNLDPRSQLSDSQLISALVKVSLWPTIDKKGGLDAIITADFLSQGQKQLFSLAQAIVRKDQAGDTRHTEKHGIGNILLLDNATRNVDRATEAAMQRVIKDEFSSFTVLAVAHRLGTLCGCDRVAVLEAGRVVEFDRPEVLLARDSAFAELHTASKREDEEC